MKKNVEIEEDFLEHLLNCLANQKFIPLPNKQSKPEKGMQEVIDKAWNKGMSMVSYNTNTQIDKGEEIFNVR